MQLDQLVACFSSLMLASENLRSTVKSLNTTVILIHINIFQEGFNEPACNFVHWAHVT